MKYGTAPIIAAAIALAVCGTTGSPATASAATSRLASCPRVRVTTGHGTNIFEARGITAQRASCRVARKLAHDVGEHVLIAVNPPGGRYDACMLTSRVCVADGFACRGHFVNRSLTERCVRGRAVVRWSEFDEDLG